jgi:hypothetical protein
MRREKIMGRGVARETRGKRQERQEARRGKRQGTLRFSILLMRLFWRYRICSRGHTRLYDKTITCVDVLRIRSRCERKCTREE